MTRKDYELIAKSIHTSVSDSYDFGFTDHQKQAVKEVITHVINNLSSALATTNPRFDETRFLQACGVFNDVVDMHR